jgi:type I restriction enzyme, S subunit
MDFSGTDFERYRLSPGDVLLTEGDLVSAHNIGRSAVFRGEIKECCFQNTLLRFRPGPAIDPEFAHLAFCCLRSLGMFAVLANGTTVFHLGAEKLKSLPVPLPPIPEQRAIAAALADVDALLASQDKLIAKKRDLKQAAMQQLLTGQTRLPGFSGEWEPATLGDLFEFRNGVNADKRAYGRGIQFINVLEVITKPHLRAADLPGRVSLPQPLIDAFQVHSGDVVFNRTSETQEEVALGAVYLDTVPVVFGGFVIRGRPSGDRIDAVYSGYALRASDVRQQIVAKGQGAIRANVGQPELRMVRVRLPGLAEQRAIATVLLDMDAEIAILETRRDKTQLLKQGMMQELLTGRTRLV